jgi:O-antigen/teichoic acid export membrane protein
MEKDLKKKVVKNIAYNFSTSIVTKIFSLIFTILIARLFQPEIFGLYNLTLSVMLVLAVLTDVGVGNALVRFVSANIKNTPKQVLYYKYLFRIKIILTFSTATFLIFLSKPLSLFLFHKPELFYPLLISAFYLLFSSFSDFFSYLFDAFSEFKFKLWREVLWQSARIIFTIGLFMLIQRTTNMAILAMVFCSIVTLGLVFFIVKKRYSLLFARTNNHLNKAEKRKLIKYLFFVSISSVSSALFAYIDTIMLGIFLPAAYVGYYRAAFALVLTAYFFISFTVVFFPVFSSLSLKKVKPLFERVLRISLIFSIPLPFGLAVLSVFLIKTIYGLSYLPAIFPLYILNILVFLSSFSLYVALFNSREKPEIPTKSMIIATIMNIVLNYILIKLMLPFGENYAMGGAAAATILSNIYFYFSLVYYSKKEFGIGINLKIILKPLLASIIMAGFLIWFNNFFKLNWLMVVLEIALAIIVYFAVLFLFKGLKKEDISLFKEVRK